MCTHAALSCLLSRDASGAIDINFWKLGHHRPAVDHDGLVVVVDVVLAQSRSDLRAGSKLGAHCDHQHLAKVVDPHHLLLPVHSCFDQATLAILIHLGLS